METAETKSNLPTFEKVSHVIDNVKAKVGFPILLYFLGVPGGLVILIWLFFFR